MQDHWLACAARLEAEVPAQLFKTWIKPLVFLGYEPDEQLLRLGAPNQFKLNWVRTQFGSRISELAAGMLGPQTRVPVVTLPSVLMASADECLRAGAAVHDTARRLGRRAVFVASTALSHVLVRGRSNWPTPERQEADARFIERLKTGRIDEAIADFPEYARFVGAEMGGRPLATLLGALRAMGADGSVLAARQYGAYTQSSGSGNAVMAIAAPEVLARLG